MRRQIITCVLSVRSVGMRYIIIKDVLIAHAKTTYLEGINMSDDKMCFLDQIAELKRRVTLLESIVQQLTDRPYSDITFDYILQCPKCYEVGVRPEYGCRSSECENNNPS